MVVGMQSINKRIIFLKNAGGEFNGCTTSMGVAVFLSSANSTKINLQLKGNFLHFDAPIFVGVFVDEKPFSFERTWAYNHDFMLNASFNENSSIFICILNEIFEPICYGEHNSSFNKLQEMIDYAKNSQSPCEINNNLSKQIETASDYDDEIIATENYFENQGLENELNDSCVYLQNESSNIKGGAQEKNGFDESQIAKEKERVYDSQKDSFYLKIKSKLDEILKTRENFDELKEIFDDSQFAKIMYDSERFYLVGVIRSNGEVKYVCYGIKGHYDNIPKELEGFCRFVPKSSFNLLGEGYYLIFQDAISGNIVT